MKKIFLILLLASFSYAQSDMLLLMDSGITYNPEALTWQTAVITAGGTVSAPTLLAISDFLDDVADIRTSLLRVNLFCGNDTAACFTPLINNADGSITPLGYARDVNVGGNFVPADYSEATGLLGATSKYLNTGFIPALISAFGQDDGGIALYAGTYVPTKIYTMGYDAGNKVAIVLFNNGQNYTGLNGSETAIAITESAGFFGLMRKSSTEYIYYNNADSVMTVTNTSGAKPNGESIAVFAKDVASPSSYTNDYMQGYCITKGLTTTQWKVLNAAMLKFQTALGRN